MHFLSLSLSLSSLLLVDVTGYQLDMYAVKMRKKLLACHWRHIVGTFLTKVGTSSGLRCAVTNQSTHIAQIQLGVELSLLLVLTHYQWICCLLDLRVRDFFLQQISIKEIY
jgi:hypothetical protein